MRKRAFIILALPVIFLFGCKENNMDELVSPETSSFQTTDYTAIDITDVMNGIDNATVDSEMSFNQTLTNYSFLGSSVSFNGMGNKFAFGKNGLKGNRWLDSLNFRKHFGTILRQLNLTQEQRTLINAFVKTFHDGMKPLIEQFRAANQNIIQEANTARRAILERLRNHEITRTEAMGEIEALNAETREKIMNNPESAIIKDQMCALRAQLLGSVESVLTDEQKIKWNEWLENLPNPC